MKTNEIIKAYGTEYEEMTIAVLEAANLYEDINNKARLLNKSIEEMRVALKPNLVSPTPADYGATTHPEVATGIIKYLQAKGLKNICIMEGSWIGDKTSDSFEFCGYNRIADEYGVTLIDAQMSPGIKTDCLGMELNVCECVKECDFFINIPVLKGHCQTKITCALKNVKGLVPNDEKRRFHTLEIHKPLACLNTYIEQDYIVVDHICGDAYYEGGGTPRITNCVYVGRDPVAIDAYGAMLLGIDPMDVEYIRRSAEFEVGNPDITALEIRTVYGVDNESVMIRRDTDVEKFYSEKKCCSACLAALHKALQQLVQEGLINDDCALTEPICAGQGYKGHTGKYGSGDCTGGFEVTVKGCPPKYEDIYDTYKKYLIQP